MTRKLQALPSAQVVVEVTLQFFHFPANAFDFHRCFSRGSREPGQFRDVTFAGVNFALALPVGFLLVGSPSLPGFFASLDLFWRFGLAGVCLLLARFGKVAPSPKPFASLLAFTHCTTATESVPQIARTCSKRSRSAITAR